MNVKFLLALAAVAAGFTAEARFNVQVRDAVPGIEFEKNEDGSYDYSKPIFDDQSIGLFKWRRDENGRILCDGHMDYKMDETWGYALPNEDGSYTFTVVPGDGVYFRTKYLGGGEGDDPNKYGKGGVLGEDHVVFAMDYKCNRPVNNLNLFHHEYAGRNEISSAKGSMFTVSDEWQTVYMIRRTGIRNNDNTANWGEEKKNYMWVNWNELTPGFEITVKDLRFLTLAEASEECKSAAGGDVVEDVFTLPNGSFIKDYDEDLECDIYSYSNNGDPNCLLMTGNHLKPLPNGVTTFQFDYILTGVDFQPAWHLYANGWSGQAPDLSGLPEKLVAIEGEEAAEKDWKTLSIDLKDQINALDFAQSFGKNSNMWLQFMQFPGENVLYVKNPRWINPNPASVSEVATSVENGRIYNVAGVEVKGELAPGLYIQNGKKFIVK